ncbi:MAG: hypothetical protein WCU88_10415 [Elusimicrobiota bacterium]
MIVGGWVPQIYAWKEESLEISVHSNDVDAAVAAKLPVRGKKSIASLMESADFKVGISDSGFALTAFAKEEKPTTRFLYRKGKVRVPVDFITPLFGSGKNDAVLIQKDLIVPALRYTNILLAHTETVSLAGETLEGERTQVRFKVPTLPAFVLAKGLTFVRRPVIEKKGKDLAYIYEILMKPPWRKRVVEGLPETADGHPAPWYRKFKRNLKEAFATENSSGPTWTALQYPSRDAAKSRREIFQTFSAFLAELK